MDRARRRAIALALALAAQFVAPGANAEAYPARPVRIIVGFIPGSSADITARVLGQRMGQILGQQFVIENKPGAGSSLAAEFVARAPKDGYTLFLGSSANITNAAINPNLSFDLAKDFTPTRSHTRRHPRGPPSLANSEELITNDESGRGVVRRGSARGPASLRRIVLPQGAVSVHRSLPGQPASDRSAAGYGMSAHPSCAGAQVPRRPRTPPSPAP
jgi:hypothetical protein